MLSVSSFWNIFSFNEAKNTGIAIAKAGIFNEMERKKNQKLSRDNSLMVLMNSSGRYNQKE